MSELAARLSGLRRAGEHPGRALLDEVIAFGPAAVGPLIEMATDERLHSADGDSPEVWAPIHAIQLLGEFRASEAVEPLLPLFPWDDDYLDTALPECYGRIGRPALETLHSLLFDRSGDDWTAGVRAAHGLQKAAEYHPELRADVVAALAARLDAPEPRTPDDETLNGFIISYLCDLDATDAMAAIRRAYAEDRVDLIVIHPEHVEDALGLPIGLSIAEAIEAGDRLRSSPRPARGLLAGAPDFPNSPPLARVARKVGRNEPCPCGSGRKFKKCCGH